MSPAAWLSSAAQAAARPGGPAAPPCGLADGHTSSASPASGPSSASAAFHFPSGSGRAFFLGHLSPKGHSCDRMVAGVWQADQGPQLLPVSVAGPEDTGEWKVSSAQRPKPGTSGRAVLRERGLGGRGPRVASRSFADIQTCPNCGCFIGKV